MTVDVMDVEKTFAELAAELTAPKPEKVEWEAAPVTMAPKGILSSLDEIKATPFSFGGFLAQTDALIANAEINAFIDLAEKAKEAQTQATKAAFQADLPEPYFMQNGDMTIYVRPGEPVETHYVRTLPTPEMVTSAECADYADAAADAIARFGWIRGQYGSPAIGMCMAGALSYVTMHAPMSKFRASHVFAAIGDRIQSRLQIGSIPSWNDRAAATKDEVVSVLREVAASFRAEVNA